MMREDRKLVYVVGFDFIRDALFEIDRFDCKEGREILVTSATQASKTKVQ